MRGKKREEREAETERERERERKEMKQKQTQRAVGSERLRADLRRAFEKERDFFLKIIF